MGYTLPFFWGGRLDSLTDMILRGGRYHECTGRKVATVEALIAATKDSGIQRIAISGHLTHAPSVRLSPGQSLRGADEGASISFTSGTDGLQLSSDNGIHSLRIDASPAKRAIFNDTSVDHLGRIELRGVA